MKECKFCKKEFNPIYKSDVHCDSTCKAKSKFEKRINNWVNAKRPSKAKRTQRIQIGYMNDMP